MAVVAVANALTTKEDVKYVWGREQADTGNDDRIQTLINKLTDRIENWCGRKFKAADYVHKFDGNGGYYLFLREYPLTADPTYVKQDDSTIDSTLYTVYKEQGYIYYAGGWSKGHQNFEVSYNSGYATIPGGLSEACIEWVIILLEGRMKDAKTDLSDAEAPPESIAMALAPWKRVDF